MTKPRPGRCSQPPRKPVPSYGDPLRFTRCPPAPIPPPSNDFFGFPVTCTPEQLNQLTDLNGNASNLTLTPLQSMQVLQKTVSEGICAIERSMYWVKEKEDRGSAFKAYVPTLESALLRNQGLMNEKLMAQKKQNAEIQKALIPDVPEVVFPWNGYNHFCMQRSRGHDYGVRGDHNEAWHQLSKEAQKQINQECRDLRKELKKLLREGKIKKAMTRVEMQTLKKEKKKKNQL